MNDPAGAEVLVDGASKSFGSVAALRSASLHVGSGEAVAITGPSGSGKSTLLALIGGLQQPDAGRVLIDGRAIWESPHVTTARRELVGFVFQRHLLLADEPTGALDSATSARVLDLLFSLRDRLGMTLLVVSYDRSVGARANRTVTIVDGAVQSASEAALSPS